MNDALANHGKITYDDYTPEQQADVDAVVI